MPVFSLDSNYSIGSFGAAARKFVDILSEAGFSWWQILPLCIPDEFNSPYNSSSLYSINPFYIDLEELYFSNLITKEELQTQQTFNNGRCDYKKLYSSRLKILYSAFLRFKEFNKLALFISQNSGVEDFCKYQSLCHVNKTNLWTTWVNFKPSEVIEKFWQFLQYKAYSQWISLKEYANKKNVFIMGDLPFYSSLCSSEVYFNKKYYQLDFNGNPIYLSGAKPDEFSSTGQCWGHPVYNWKNIKNNDFKFFKTKFSFYSMLYDGIRLDHFRGYESYWVVPKTRDALNGHYEKGPGVSLFNAMKDYTTNKIIVGEDLGIIAPEVQHLINESGFYNMRVFQYCLENPTLDLPTNFTDNCVAYTGTHDTHTLFGFLNSLSQSDMARLRQNLKLKDSCNIYKNIIHSMLESNAKIVFFTIQDILKLDDNFVINVHTPSETNWSFRLKDIYQLENAITDFLNT